VLIRVALLAILLGSPLSADPHSAKARWSRRRERPHHRLLRGHSRPPADGSGQQFWEGEAERLQSLGADVNELFRVMSTSFFESPEYLARNRTNTAYVGDLYQTFFRRSPDASGEAFWVGQLAQGLPRSGVMQHFQFSAEFNPVHAIPVRKRTGTRQRRRGHGPVPRHARPAAGHGGLSYWSERLRLAQCAGQASVTGNVDTISALFLGSTEYAGRQRSNAQYVADLYNAFMRRGPDASGFQFWVGELNAGRQTRESLRQVFRDSNEFQMRVAAVVAEGASPSRRRATSAPALRRPARVPSCRSWTCGGSASKKCRRCASPSPPSPLPPRVP
jgi:hypothetical protein